ncbi:MAG: hypothetical protein RL481_1260, partial [Pseudomonadota bacterium]
ADRALVETAERTMITEKIPVELYFRKGRERAGAPPVPACSMLIDEVEAIWAAIGERNEWQPLTRKIEEIRAMGAALRTSAA